MQYVFSGMFSRAGCEAGLQRKMEPHAPWVSLRLRAFRIVAVFSRTTLSASGVDIQSRFV